MLHVTTCMQYSILHMYNERGRIRGVKQWILLTESVSPSLKVTLVIISRGSLDEASYSKDDSWRKGQVTLQNSCDY